VSTRSTKEDRAGTTPPVSPSSGLYYGWVLVLTLGVTETVSYGILTYAFPVFLAPMEAELGWSRTALTGAFSLASLVAGVAAIPVGGWVDRHGARGLMTAGSLLAALLLASWAGVERLWAFYAVWVGLGLASAAVLYEPAFAVLASWFHRRRGRALTVLTFMGGFASVIFVPLATGLVAAHGWRSALLWLAGIMLVLTALPHALLLRRQPSDHGMLPDGGVAGGASPENHPARSVPAREAVRSRSFRLLALCFSLASLVTTGLAVHLIPLLLERGFTATFAGAAMGAVGLMALPGRLIFTPLGGHWPRPAVTASIFGLQALGVAALLFSGGAWGVWAFVALFGAGFGAITPARAALVAELFGPAHFGRISGMLALFLSVARAAAPVGTSLLHVALGGYAGVLWTMLALSVLAGAAVLLTGDGSRDSIFTAGRPA
jgi:MFS family permease